MGVLENKGGKLVVSMKEEGAISFFTEGAMLDETLEAIKAHATNFVADPNTKEGRKALKSKAREVASLKVALDKFGKKIVSDWKRQAKEVDGRRKHIRDFLDEVRNDVRRPASEWEEAQRQIEEAEAWEKELAEMWEEAVEVDAQFEKQKELEKKEAEIKAREERVRQEEREKEIKEKTRKEERQRAEKERVAAVEAERARVAAQKRAEEEKKRKAKEAEEKRVADKKHREKVRREAINDLDALNLDVDKADMQRVVEAISEGKIRHLSINY